MVKYFLIERKELNRSYRVIGSCSQLNQTVVMAVNKAYYRYEALFVPSYDEIPEPGHYIIPVTGEHNEFLIVKSTNRWFGEKLNHTVLSIFYIVSTDIGDERATVPLH